MRAGSCLRQRHLAICKSLKVMLLTSLAFISLNLFPALHVNIKCFESAGPYSGFEDIVSSDNCFRLFQLESSLIILFREDKKKTTPERNRGPPLFSHIIKIATSFPYWGLWGSSNISSIPLDIVDPIGLANRLLWFFKNLRYQEGNFLLLHQTISPEWKAFLFARRLFSFMSKLSIPQVTFWLGSAWGGRTNIIVFLKEIKIKSRGGKPLTSLIPIRSLLVLEALHTYMPALQAHLNKVRKGTLCCLFFRLHSLSDLFLTRIFIMGTIWLLLAAKVVSEEVIYFGEPPSV